VIDSTSIGCTRRSQGKTLLGEMKINLSDDYCRFISAPELASKSSAASNSTVNALNINTQGKLVFGTQSRAAICHFRVSGLGYHRQCSLVQEAFRDTSQSSQISQ